MERRGERVRRERKRKRERGERERGERREDIYTERDRDMLIDRERKR